MPDTDAPQVEPLTLTLEELIQFLAGEGMWLDYNDNYDRRRWCVMERDPYEGNAVVARDVTPCKAASSALGVPVVPRDPAAELVETLEAVTKAEYDPGVGEYAMTVATMRRVQAALARVRGGAK